jgi:hypothetical protein
MRQQRSPQRWLTPHPAFFICSVLMNPERRTIDRLHIPVTGPRDCREEAVPCAELSPPDKAVTAGCAGRSAPGIFAHGESVRSRQKMPLSPFSTWNAARLVRQQRRNDRPVEIGELVAVWAHRSTSRYPESSLAASLPGIYELVT